MADQPLLGVFQEEKGLAVSGEPYDKPVDVHTRHHGKQFAVPDCSAVSGHGPDTWFDKNLQLATPADKYHEPLDLPTIVAARAGPGAGDIPQSNGRPLHEAPFRPSNPSQRPGKASGSLYGTFGPLSLFFVAPEGHGKDSQRPNTVPITQESLGNIYTNNPKQGGPGYPDQYRLLSGGSYTYEPDEYDRGRSLEKDLKHVARARIQKPFWGGTRANGVFTSDSELYGMPPAPRQPSRSRSASDGRPSWRPNNPAPKGRYCGLLSSPSYIPSPSPPDKPQPQLRNYPSPARPFVPTSAGHRRLSMWSVNPYERQAVTPGAGIRAGTGVGLGGAGPVPASGPGLGAPHLSAPAAVH